MASQTSYALAECDAERKFLLLTPASNSLHRNSAAREKSLGACKAETARDLAFSALVDRHTRLMYRIAFSLLRNAQDAEDTVQEMFLKLYRGDAWQRVRDEKAFLARVVWRTALNQLPRKKNLSLDQSHEQFADRRDSPETTAIRNAQTAYLRRMIDALPEDLRRVLVLSAIEDLNSREVGLMIGVPEGTVRTRLMRAREELQKRYETAYGRKR